jgi:hypothetical protein
VIETQSVANLMHGNLGKKNARMRTFPHPPVTAKGGDDALLSSQVSQTKDAPVFYAPMPFCRSREAGAPAIRYQACPNQVMLTLLSWSDVPSKTGIPPMISRSEWTMPLSSSSFLHGNTHFTLKLNI